VEGQISGGLPRRNVAVVVDFLNCTDTVYERRAWTVDRRRASARGVVFTYTFFGAVGLIRKGDFIQQSIWRLGTFAEFGFNEPGIE
jgi:hypothetical protein